MLAMLPTNLDTASVISTVGTLRDGHPGCKMLLLCSNNLDNIPEVAIYIQGGFFDCSALKMTKCQPLKEISELFLPKND